MAIPNGFSDALEALQITYPDVAVMWYMREDVDENRRDDDDELIPLTDDEWHEAKEDLIDTVYHVVSNTDAMYDIARRSMNTEEV